MLRVVELSDGVAGAVCGSIMAALGHEVVVVEPPQGHPLRGAGPRDDSGVGYAFRATAAGKHSVVADAADEDGRARIEELLAAADLAIIEQAPPGGPLGPHAVRARWPHLAVVAITGYGLDDPRSDDTTDSMLAEAAGGLLSMIGDPARRPLALGGEQAAHIAAVAGVLGGMLTLHGAPAGGLVDVALRDVVAYLDWKGDVSRSISGRTPARTGGFEGRWRILPAADGWLGVVFQAHQWADMVRLIGDPRLDDARLATESGRAANADLWWPVVEAWAAARPMRDAAAEAQLLGLPFGAGEDIREVAEHRRRRAQEAAPDPDGRHPAVGTPFRTGGPLRWRTGPVPQLGDTGAAAAWSSGPRDEPHRAVPAEGPLAGLLVLDLGTITAGAATSRLLADYGATVIKIESPGRPDPFRDWTAPPAADGTQFAASESPMFPSNNVGKLGITLDLKSDHGREVMRALVRQADVLVENFRVGVTARLGVDPAAVHAVNPDLLYVSLISHGRTGPESRRTSYGSTLDMLSGLASLTGYGDGRPVWTSEDVNYPDQLASLFGAAMIVHCLVGGVRGTHLDLSQREIVSWTLSDRILRHVDSGVVDPAEGNRRPGSTPHEVYPCAGEDRWIAIACRTDAQRAALSALVGLAPPSSAPRWWEEHVDEVDAAVWAWTRARTREECSAALTTARVPHSAVVDAADRAADRAFVDRRVLLDGPPRLKGFPFVLDWCVPPDPAAAPRVGEHDDIIAAALDGTLRDAAARARGRRRPDTAARRV